jgi:hypothetical protein
MRAVRILLVLIVVAVVAFLGVSLAYARIRSDNTGTAIATAQRFLESVCDTSGDRGWDELDATQRRAGFHNLETYLARAATSDCSRFTAERFAAYCDDGVCAVWFSVPDEAAIPDFLTRAGIVDYRTDHVPPGTNAAMGITQRGPFGQGVFVAEE